jgi:3-oxoacyl-[acyl-carrier-protein] synthase II
VPPFEAPFPRRVVRRASRADLLGLCAAREAVAAAGLAPADLATAAVVHGTGAGGAQLLERYVARTLARGLDRAPPSWLVPQQPATTTDLIANELGAFGPRTTLMTACSSSATALGYGADLIRLGRADVVIAGGTEALCRLTFGGFSALRVLDPSPCRPFDAARAGLNLGEGSALLVLEGLDHARRRGARVQAELCGYGVSADAHHLTAPDPTGGGPARAMRAALADAGVPPEAVDYVNAHGTATAHNDPVETAALHAAFGAHAAALLVSSTKAMFGHTLGAAGALEAVVATVALEDGLVPPTLGLERADPACDLDYVAGAPRRRPLRHVLSSSFAFGGHNTCLLFGNAEALP